MKQDSRKQTLILSGIGVLPVIWTALLIAPTFGGGLAEMLPKWTAALSSPLHITWCEDSANGIGTAKTVLVFLLIYAFALLTYHYAKHNYRKREEHGSAKWGDAAAVDKKYRAMPASENKLLTQHVRIGLDGRKHRRNLNILICGGSGAGKTRFYAKPNVMQCNTSMVILDPNGKIVLL